MKKLLVILFVVTAIIGATIPTYAVECPHPKDAVIGIEYRPFDDTYSHKLIKHKCLACDEEWVDDVAILNENIPVVKPPHREVPMTYVEHHEWVFQEGKYEITEEGHSYYAIYKCSICKQSRVAFKEEIQPHQLNKDGACIVCGYKPEPTVKKRMLPPYLGIFNRTIRPTLDI